MMTKASVSKKTNRATITFELTGKRMTMDIWETSDFLATCADVADGRIGYLPKGINIHGRIYGIAVNPNMPKRPIVVKVSSNNRRKAPWAVVARLQPGDLEQLAALVQACHDALLEGDYGPVTVPLPEPKTTPCWRGGFTITPEMKEYVKGDEAIVRSVADTYPTGYMLRRKDE